MSEELPKLELLIKIMKMTAAEDGPALTAIRKANSMLASEGWDWERLLRGKVKIIADPFSGTAAPPRRTTPQPAPMRPYVRPSYAPAHAAPQPQAPAASNPWPGGQKPQPQPTGRWSSAASPPTSPPPATAKPGPIHFQRGPGAEWCIAFYLKMDSQIGQKVTVEKRDGTKAQEVLGIYVGTNPTSGHHLYKIAKASKWKRATAADTSSIDDII